MEKEYEAKGAEYEVDDEVFEYLECQQYYYNNNMVSCLDLHKESLILILTFVSHIVLRALF